jgi:hypothetical protein
MRVCAQKSVFVRIFVRTGAPTPLLCGQERARLRDHALAKVAIAHLH